MNFDPNHIAIYLAALALILTLPLALLANLLTPVIRNWWVRRSLKRTEARIATLMREQAEDDTQWVFTDAETKTYELLAVAYFSISGLGDGLYGIFLLVFIVFLRELQLTLMGRFLFGIMLVPLYLLNKVIYLNVRRMVWKAQRLHTTHGRERARRELESLVAIREASGALRMDKHS